MKKIIFFLQIHLLKSAENIEKNRFSVRKSCQNFISVKLSYSKTCLVAILAVFFEKNCPESYTKVPVLVQPFRDDKKKNSSVFQNPRFLDFRF